MDWLSWNKVSEMILRWNLNLNLDNHEASSRGWQFYCHLEIDKSTRIKFWFVVKSLPPVDYPFTQSLQFASL